MTFDGLNLNPFSKIQSDSGKQGFSNMPMLERKAKARLLANQYANEQAVEAAKLGYQAQLDAFKPKETSWGDVAMGVAGSAAKAGLFDNFGGNQFSGRGSSGTDAWGRDFDDPYATVNTTGLITSGDGWTEWNTDMPIPSSGGNAWWNPFGWGG